MPSSQDQKTANAFATSWNNLPVESVYTFEQFTDWMNPIQETDVKERNVLELGCGNGSLLVHLQKWSPGSITGVDLGGSVQSAESNLQKLNYPNYNIIQEDLTAFRGPLKYDIVYSIGVLHHLTNPKSGFESVVLNTRPGGKFHCWVYAHEGNAIVIHFVDPIRRIACHLPWFINKYLISAPLAYLFFIYANLITKMMLKEAPLYKYCQWICTQKFKFFRHVVFDQLVTPTTHYIKKQTIETWLKGNLEINQQTVYIISRNGNSWKFGGERRK
jgi:SAM-dependent methyltransferase